MKKLVGVRLKNGIEDATIVTRHRNNQTTVDFGDRRQRVANHRLVEGAELERERDQEARQEINDHVKTLRDNHYPSMATDTEFFKVTALFDAGDLDEFYRVCRRAEMYLAMEARVHELLRVLALYVPEGQVGEDIKHVRRLFPGGGR